ncbi:hypothetical protein GW17_00040759 [Ensete ventricosum]|nr:hypothetical protein GW17_00040759 [Ensete ventricosum]
MEATINSSTEPLLSSRVSNAHSLSRANYKLKSFESYLRWMSVDQFNAKHVMVS